MAVNVRLSKDERVEIILLCGVQQSFRDIAVSFNNKNPNRHVDHSTVRRLLTKFKDTGSVNDIHRCPSLSVSGDDNATYVLGVLQNSPKKSVRKLSQETNVSKSSIHRILQKHKFHPYKMQLSQELQPDDSDRRLEYCEWLLQRPFLEDFVENIMFSDEAIFYVSGKVNRHNFRYWSSENPKWVEDRKVQGDPRIMVWAGIWNVRIIGPFYFDTTVDKDSYLTMLKTFLQPIIDELPLNQRIKLWFQQDGAPAHFAKSVREYLDSEFTNQWIGRRGTAEWPPRSPDMNPLDYFLWGHLKSCIYNSRPRSLDDLRHRISNEMAKISVETIRLVQASFIHRCGKCMEVEGEHFEYLL